MHNLAAATFAQACTEMDRMLQVMGGSRAFARGLPAPGDLYVTVQGGRSMRLGKLLGLGHTYAETKQILAGETLEAAYVVQVLGEALPKLVARGIVSAADFPLMQALIDVVIHERPVDLPFDAFF